MPTEMRDLLVRLADAQADLKARQTEMADTLGAHTDILGLVSGQLAIIIERLTPAVGDGPTLQEVLAELMVRVGDGLVLLRRLDRNIDDLAAGLPIEVARAIKSDGTANNAWSPSLPRGEV